MNHTERRLIDKSEEVRFDKNGNIIKSRVARKFASDEEIAKQLIVNKGFISKVAENLNVSTTYVKTRIKTNKALAEICNSMDDRILDLAESKLVELIAEKDFEAIKFVLKTKGKDRGYSESVNIGTGDGKAITLNLVPIVPGSEPKNV